VVEPPSGSPSTDLVKSVESDFLFHVFPDSYWSPLEVVSNSSLLVEEGTSIAITGRDLQVKLHV